MITSSLQSRRGRRRGRPTDAAGVARRAQLEAPSAVDASGGDADADAAPAAASAAL